MYKYREFLIEKSDNGWIVTYCGDEIVCNSVEHAKRTIDELYEYEERNIVLYG